MVHTYTIDGLPVETGDLICTVDGTDEPITGQFWRLVGKIIPGDVDHIVVYVGPDGHCVEAGPKGVITFDVTNNTWDAKVMFETRGMLDELYGIAYPLKGTGLSDEEIARIRASVADYCMAQVGKRYNMNFPNADTEEAFYCSQLAYKAYRPYGINLNTNTDVPDIPGTDSIIFPQEIWSGCAHSEAIT